MDPHERRLQYSIIIVRQSSARVARWAADDAMAAGLLRGSVERVSISRAALTPKLAAKQMPFSWFMPGPKH